MKQDLKVLNRALEIKENQRTDAFRRAEIKKEKIEKEIPEIEVLNKEIAATSKQILNAFKDKKNFAENLKLIKENNLKLQNERKDLLSRLNYSEDYFKPQFLCKKCEDTGISEGKYCECVFDLIKKLRLESLQKRSCIELCDFDSFNLDYYKNIESDDQSTGDNFVSAYERMSEIFEYCKAWSMDFSPDRSTPSILMCGRTGLGKTHLSLAIAKAVIDNGYGVIYDSAQNLLGQIEDVKFGRLSYENNPMDVIISCDLLILDDLGTEFNTQFNTSAFYNIINTRMAKGLPMIINTNLSFIELEARYDERIMSRILGYFDYLQFLGSDVRQLKLED